MNEEEEEEIINGISRHFSEFLLESDSFLFFSFHFSSFAFQWNENVLFLSVIALFQTTTNAKSIPTEADLDLKSKRKKKLITCDIHLTVTAFSFN